MTVLNARRLHNETSAILDEVSKGKSFQITRNGKLIGRLEPANDDIMSDAWKAQKEARRKVANPVLAERARRRR